MIKSPYIEDLCAAVASVDSSILCGKSILITGATGLIGGALAEALLLGCKDCQVYANGRSLERLESRFKAYEDCSNLHLLARDIASGLPEGMHFDYIVHAAGFANPKLYSTSPVEVMRTTLESTTALLEHCRACGVERFLYVSSGEVYGECKDEPVTEHSSGYVDSMTVRSCYPSSKRAAETLCAAYADEYGIDTVVARPCHVYGPGFTDSDNRAFAQFIRNAIAGKDIVLKSKGEQYRSWCYAPDCVSALLHILLKGSKGQAYTIASPNENVSIKELAQTIAEACKRKVVFEIPEEIEKKGYNPVTKSVFSASMLENLGWRASSTLRENICKTIDALTNGKA